MTVIEGLVRRPGVLAVHSLDHFGFSVPDLEEARNFYASFGLDVQETSGRLALHTHGTPHRWAQLSEGGRKKALGHLSFGVFQDDLERFRQRIEQAGVRLLDPPAGMEEGLWLRDCDGILVQLKVAEKTSPNAKSVCELTSSAPGVAAAPLRGTAELVQPRRLSHIMLFTPDVARKVAFYERILGLRLSDEAGGVVAFMHGAHGSDHHLIAFAKAETSGLHHASWDVRSVHEIGLGAMQMADKGFAAGWGLGRHVLGSNYFHYVRDPWGSYSEYSAEIDYVPCGHDWRAGSYPPENALYLWGPTPPEDFVTNYEIDR